MTSVWLSWLAKAASRPWLPTEPSGGRAAVAWSADATLDNQFTLVSSELTEVELVRAVSKRNVELIRVAREVLRAIVLLPISSSVREAAGEISPGKIRSLDAIHRSTALEIKADLAGLLTLEKRMAY